VSSPCSGHHQLGESGVQVGDVKAQPALALLLGSAAVKGDRRFPPMELTPERGCEIDGETENVPVEGHGPIHVADRKHEVGLGDVHPYTLGNTASRLAPKRQ
jgi:hypothetical protein